MKDKIIVMTTPTDNGKSCLQQSIDRTTHRQEVSGFFSRFPDRKILRFHNPDNPVEFLCPDPDIVNLDAFVAELRADIYNSFGVPKNLLKGKQFKIPPPTELSMDDLISVGEILKTPMEKAAEAFRRFGEVANNSPLSQISMGIYKTTSSHDLNGIPVTLTSPYKMFSYFTRKTKSKHSRHIKVKTHTGWAETLENDKVIGTNKMLYMNLATFTKISLQLEDHNYVNKS